MIHEPSSRRLYERTNRKMEGKRVCAFAVWKIRSLLAEQILNESACGRVCVCPRVYYKRAATTPHWWCWQKASCAKATNRRKKMYGERSNDRGSEQNEHTAIAIYILKRRIMRPITLVVWAHEPFQRIGSFGRCLVASFVECMDWFCLSCYVTVRTHMHRVRMCLWPNEPNSMATHGPTNRLFDDDGFCSKIIFGAKNQ